MAASMFGERCEAALPRVPHNPASDRARRHSFLLSRCRGGAPVELIVRRQVPRLTGDSSMPILLPIMETTHGR